MPLVAPNLDTRTFEDLVKEARLRIPRYTPEWTDFNESDPGMTLVELFAWFTDYIKFLQLLGMELRPAQPAAAHITFTASAGAQVESVQLRSQLSAQPPGGGEPLIFETEAGLDLIRVPLADVQVYDGTAFDVVTQANQTPGTGFRPLGWIPQVGSALYLAFPETNPPAVKPIFPQEIRMRVFLPPSAGRCAAERQRRSHPAGASRRPGVGIQTFHDLQVLAAAEPLPGREPGVH